MLRVSFLSHLSKIIIFRVTNVARITTPCPNCGKKGLHYCEHPHAQGYKDHSKVECRFCKKRFKVKGY